MSSDIHYQLIGEASRILDLLGIDDTSLIRKIRCPLKNHKDRNPSFRVDRNKNRYYCSCTPRGASLIDLVIGMHKAGEFTEAVNYLRFNLKLNGNSSTQKYNSFDSTSSIIPPYPSQENSDRNSEMNIFDEYINSCIPMHQHPYARSKKISPIGTLFDRETGNLVLRVHDINGVTKGCQLISPSGDKWFAKGTQLRGNGLLLGSIEKETTIGICEGWATGATLFSLVNRPILVTFSSNNLLAAAKPYKDRKLEIKIFGDRDSSGIGQRSALEAAAALGSRVYFPPGDEPDFDFNDYYVSKILAKR